MAALMRVALYAKSEHCRQGAEPGHTAASAPGVRHGPRVSRPGSMSTTPRRTTSVAGPRGARCWPRGQAQLDMILVWKLDRAFRSVAHMAQTVEQFRRWGVGLRSYSEPWLDTSGTSPVADLMLNIMASFAQFERY